MRELYFHEDDYLQVEMMPVSALGHCTDEMRESDAFSATHWNGTAWTSMYLLDDHSAYLKRLGISIHEIAPRLDSILEPVDEVFTGYSTYRERCSNTKAWVFPCGCGLLADYDADGVVLHLWLVYEPPHVQHFGKFKEVVGVLDAYSQFIIVDWKKSHLLQCADDDKMRRYFIDPFDGAD
jgi:hypothetical protein